MFEKNVDVDGTCLQGHITISYDELVKVFGEPDDGDGYKTDAEWSGSIDGVVFTIYNWKNGKNYCGPEGIPTEKIMDWNIGGNSKQAEEIVKKYIWR